jgi:hypothetical protein
MRGRLLLVFVFAVAMAYLEAAVVVYLRDILYPEGFAFPLRTMDPRLALVELGREAATVVMLLAVAFVAETKRRGRLACFMMLFGIWDIFYYFWLVVMVGWPGSFLTWDVLFLIPVIWTGPVVAPMMVSVLMILTGLLYYGYREAAEDVPITRIEWAVAIGSAIVMFGAFGYNHAEAYGGRMPETFPWGVFIAGFVAGAIVLLRIGRRLTRGA